MLPTQETSQGVEARTAVGRVIDLTGRAAQVHRCHHGAATQVHDRDAERVRVRLTVTPGPEGPREARRLAATCASEGGFDGDDLAVVVTELVTNAVRHGTPPVAVEIGALPCDRPSPPECPPCPPPKKLNITQRWPSRPASLRCPAIDSALMVP